ncbi:MAG: arginine--tRNA ligase, partial [Crocinitomicaceae bacterium]|nr:arginine--tRNA ligase [Crocinitomicaceae bacterium]
MENKIKQLLLEHSVALFGIEIEESLVQFQQTRKEFEGDLTLVVFPFVKILKSSPNDVACKIGDFLTGKLQEIARYNVVQGFLNI